MSVPEKDPEMGLAGGKTGVISFILLLLVIIGIAILAYIKIQNGDMDNLNIKELIKTDFFGSSDKSSTKKLISQFEYDSKEHPVFNVYKDSILKSTKDNVMCLNRKGEVLWNKSVEINNPFIKTAGAYAVVADLNGRYFYVIDGKNIIWDQKLDGNIINIDINEKGYISVVKEMAGYKGAVQVYDPQGNWVFTSAKAENYVLSARVLPSCDRVIVNMLDATGINADSLLEHINMSGEILGNVKKSDIIFPSIWTMNGDTVVAVSDTMAMCLDKERKIKWKYEYGRILSSSSILGKATVLAVKMKNKNSISNRRKTDINILNAAGDVTADFAVDGDVLNIEAYESSIAVNTGREVYFISAKGKSIGKYTSKTDILEVKLFNRDEAAIISKNNIVVTKIN